MPKRELVETEIGWERKRFYCSKDQALLDDALQEAGRSSEDWFKMRFIQKSCTLPLGLPEYIKMKFPA